MKKFALNYADLSKALGISRGALLRFRGLRLPSQPTARADGRHDIKKWARFISANATRATTGTATIPTGPKDLARIKLMEIQTMREETRLNKERQELLGEVKALMVEWSSKLLLRLDRLARTELPPLLDGKPVRQVGRLIRDKMRDAWNQTPLRVKIDIDPGTGRLRAKDVTNVIEFKPAKVAKKADSNSEVAL